MLCYVIHIVLQDQYSLQLTATVAPTSSVVILKTWVLDYTDVSRLKFSKTWS